MFFLYIKAWYSYKATEHSLKTIIAVRRKKSRSKKSERSLKKLLESKIEDDVLTAGIVGQVVRHRTHENRDRPNNRLKEGILWRHKVYCDVIGLCDVMHRCEITRVQKKTHPKFDDVIQI